MSLSTKYRTRRLGIDWTQIMSKNYTAQIKHFDNPAHFGINGGRISKLGIQSSTKPKSFGIINYDRGWSKRLKKSHSTEVKKLYHYIIKKYN